MTNGILRTSALFVVFPSTLGAGPQTSDRPLHGWSMVTTEPSADEHGRWSAVAGFSVAADEAIDPAIAAGGETAKFRAQVRIAKTGRFRFGLEAEGGSARLIAHDVDETSKEGLGLELALDSGGKTMSAEPAELSRGEIGIEVQFKRVGSGAARLRLLWQREPDTDGGGFGPEPISTYFTRVPDDMRAVVGTSDLALEGRALLQRKGCVQCHAAGRGASLVSNFEAPRLDHLGLRVDRAWVERWIRDPAKVKPSTDMPSLYPLDEGDSAAVASWLTQEKPKTEDAKIANEAFVLERGRNLYHTIGCVACHGAFDKASTVFGEAHADDDAAMPASNFGDLAGKWRPTALSEFLRDPAKTHPSGRMPSFKLSQDESDALANYLSSKWGPASSSPPQAPLGEVWSLSTCAACHFIEGVKRTATLGRPLAQLDLKRGCLDPKDRATPRYSLSAHELEALRAGIDEVVHVRSGQARLERTRTQMEFLNCGACHARDGRGGASEGVRAYFSSLDEKADLGNEGRIPPDLSGVGFKLTTSWMQKVIGEGARARPYLATRMPVFAAAATAGLADGLARCEGIEPNSDAPEPTPEPESLQAGRALMGPSALACANCHVFRDFAPLGTPGPRIDMFAERLRYEWWSAYMQDPNRFKPGTKMPSFESGGKSACRTILEGDLKKQLDALWIYQNLGEFMPAPEGIEHGKGLQLVVGARPIVLRTFMESVGARAIAVGMPSGLHYAFDAQSVRLAECWRGDFLDASAAWTGRGGENVGGEGPGIWKAPPGAVFTIPTSDGPIVQWPAEVGAQAGLKFRGYSIDAEGVPTFEYRWKEWDVSERVITTPLPKPRILRNFKMPKAPPAFAINTGPGDNRVYVTEAGDVLFSNRDHGIRRFEIRLMEPGAGCTFTLEIIP